MFSEVVDSKMGRNVVFRAAGDWGGIEEFLGMRKQDAVKARGVEFTTTTLDDILARARAPRYIHYMSIDIEGAEYEALQGLSLDRNQVAAFTIEHNLEEPKRTRIRKHLEGRGYRLAASVLQDDWYIRDDLVQELNQ